MPRSRRWLAMAALTLPMSFGAIGCAHCTSCGDFPRPCLTGNCGAGGPAPTMLGAPMVSGPMVSGPVFMDGPTTQFLGSGPATITSQPAGSAVGGAGASGNGGVSGSPTDSSPPPTDGPAPFSPPAPGGPSARL